MSYLPKDNKPSNAPIVNKGEPGWENKQKNWGSAFATDRQQRENITVDQSLDIIEDAQKNGITIRTKPGTTSVPSATAMDGTQLSLRVRDAKTAEDNEKKNGPATNPFLKKDVRVQPAKKNLSDLP